MKDRQAGLGKIPLEQLTRINQITETSPPPKILICVWRTTLW